RQDAVLGLRPGGAGMARDRGEGIGLAALRRSEVQQLVDEKGPVLPSKGSADAALHELARLGGTERLQLLHGQRRIQYREERIEALEGSAQGAAAMKALGLRVLERIVATDVAHPGLA